MSTEAEELWTVGVATRVVHLMDAIEAGFLDEANGQREPELAVLTAGAVAGSLVADRLDVMLNVLDRIACSLDDIRNEISNSSALQ